MLYNGACCNFGLFRVARDIDLLPYLEPYMEMEEKTHNVSLWLLMVFESF